MRLLLSYLFYYLGDIISRTTMVWGNGFGYSFYSYLMNASVNLDTNHKIWKTVKPKKKRKKS
jgi:hypothetical protein